jgi:hypothetical protein
MTAIVLRLWRAPAVRRTVRVGVRVARPPSAVRVALLLLTVAVWGALLWGMTRHG